MKPKDGACMAESEIEAFNMYECLKGARWFAWSSVSSRLRKRHVYVKALIFVSRIIDRVACTIPPQVHHKFNRYYLPYRYFTLAPFTVWPCKKSPSIARMIQVSVTFSCPSFDLSSHFRKLVAIIGRICSVDFLSWISLNSHMNFMRTKWSFAIKSLQFYNRCSKAFAFYSKFWTVM